MKREAKRDILDMIFIRSEYRMRLVARFVLMFGSIAASVACKDTLHRPEINDEAPILAQRTPETDRYAGDPIYLQANSNFFFQSVERKFHASLR